VIVEGYFPTSATHQTEFEAYLDSLDFEYYEDSELTFETQTCLDVENKTKVLFDELHYLAKIIYSGLGSSPPN
jgi:hypothetical protein